MPDGLEEIFTPNKYSIVDTIYKLTLKLNNHIKNHPSSSSGDSNLRLTMAILHMKSKMMISNQVHLKKQFD